MNNSSSRPQQIEIEVPASIANLGSGFDTLAVAVQLYLRVKATVAPGNGQLEFSFVGQKPRGQNLIELGFRHLAGQSLETLPSLSVEVDSDIPMGAGLGSSAAATIAGLRLYDAIAGPVSQQATLNAACGLEGHPDNASAALLGGLTASCQLGDGSVHAVTFSWPTSIGFIVLTPNQCLGTKQSRAALPQSVLLSDAVHNLQRMALLLHSLQQRDSSMLKHALSDRLHQAARQSIVPGLKESLELQHPDLLGVFLSGSGPSIVALAERNFSKVAEVLASTYKPLGLDFSIRILRVHEASQQSRLTGKELFGGASRDRTDDLIVANDALSQLSYSPTRGWNRKSDPA